jgi:hypothetical protein
MMADLLLPNFDYDEANLSANLEHSSGGQRPRPINAPPKGSH